MKTKILILVGSAAIVTLSFTFVKVNKNHTTGKVSQATSQSPVGGFASEEIVK
jgi:hypothetical protein